MTTILAWSGANPDSFIEWNDGQLTGNLVLVNRVSSQPTVRPIVDGAEVATNLANPDHAARLMWEAVSEEFGLPVFIDRVDSVAKAISGSGGAPYTPRASVAEGLSLPLDAEGVPTCPVCGEPMMDGVCPDHPEGT